MNLKAFRLQQDLARRRIHVVALVDSHSVYDHRDPVARTDAFHPSPFTQRTVNIVFAPCVDELFEVWLVLRPPKLFARVDGWLAALAPARAAVASHDGVARQRHRNLFPGTILASNYNEVAD